MPDQDDDAVVAEVASRHGLSQEAVRVLWRAVRAGGGLQAQLAHADLGGMGQRSDGLTQGNSGEEWGGQSLRRLAGMGGQLVSDLHDFTWE